MEFAGTGSGEMDPGLTQTCAKKSKLSTRGSLLPCTFLRMTLSGPPVAPVLRSDARSFVRLLRCSRACTLTSVCALLASSFVPHATWRTGLQSTSHRGRSPLGRPWPLAAE